MAYTGFYRWRDNAALWAYLLAQTQICLEQEFVAYVYTSEKH
jgi:hypothetical protein